MDIQTKKDLICYLESQITPNKRQKMHDVIKHRTRHVTVMVEDIFQEHNASAIVRSLECFGVQDLHIIQDKFNFSVIDGVAMGSSKWISMYNHASIMDGYKDLKAQGYRIVATTPHTDACTLEELPLEGKFAVVFGTERLGLSQYALEHADEYVKIPMVGFTESFNVSVSAALCLYALTTRLRQSDIPWQLSEPEELDIRLAWLRGIIRGSDEFARLFAKNR